MTRAAWFVVIFVLLLALGAAGAFVYYSMYSPDRAKYPLRGVDVSHHQGTIDWPRVARSDVSFAILKATEGGDYVDDTFARNLAGARAAGLVVGVYHFFTFCRPGAEQAKNFLAAVPRDQPLLPPVVDIEFGGNCATRPTVADLGKELSDFLKPVETAFDRPAILYVMDDVVAQYGAALPDRKRWVRSLVWPPSKGGWVYWQYHNAGRVDGIATDVDLNVLGGDAQVLQSLLLPPPRPAVAG
jgi:lysozyme